MLSAPASDFVRLPASSVSSTDEVELVAEEVKPLEFRHVFDLAFVADLADELAVDLA